MMQTEQRQWAAQLRAIPADFRAAVSAVEDHTLRHRPALGEWSAIEVVGHMIDKMQAWSERVERIITEDQPLLLGFDQDAFVRDRGYQNSNLETLLRQLTQVCEHFAQVVEQLPDSVLERKGLHSENGLMTLRQCIEAPLASVPNHLAQLRAALAI